ncbi:ribosome biogenesis GTP-binding protein YihA/YsxC [Clostridium tyrobutyricum]|uniref:ribosome biogenesis GTP-binding protein YihA/YsxC n=1 Tax=Clostridium tyrobutyricum TaxID=1519 RepID=UPI001C380513|nr:ribosome biogenesis GTP-binding protein YihA/YsxC [Clostridium tyrobutyricum]
MEIKQAEFIISAVKKNQYPNDNFKEIAFVGRSNVGKSSLINTIVNRRKLVKVSSSPGKTRLVNFFMINNEFYFVDLPGYGYAKVSKSEKDKWSKIIETYLVGRHQLKAIVLLVDSRHKPTNDDIIMYKWIEYYKYKILIVATKVDKISKSQLNKNLDIIRNSFGLKPDYKILTFSSLKKQGKEELLNKIEHVVEGD